jgi:hypothetical protein
MGARDGLVILPEGQGRCLVRCLPPGLTCLLPVALNLAVPNSTAPNLAEAAVALDDQEIPHFQPILVELTLEELHFVDLR